MYIKVFIDKSASSFDTLYTYRTNEYIEPGCRVIVPFGRGNRKAIGIVLYNLEESDVEKTKDILEVIDEEPIIDEKLIELGLFLKKRYLRGYFKSFQPILPPGDIKSIEVYAESDSEEVPENLLNVDIKTLSEEDRKTLKKYKEKGVLNLKYKVKSEIKEKFVTMYRLSDDYLEQLYGKKLTNQGKYVVEYLSKNGDSELKEILEALSISSSPVKTLVRQNIVKTYEKKETRDPYAEEYTTVRHPLNEEQLNALEGIINSYKTVNLLHGKTGSGKTEVYLKLAEDVIEKGGQVCMLVPEIGLTPQMIERFRGRFPGRVSILHSRLSLGERFDQYLKIKNDEVDIVVGARSAVFAPFKNLKMIIIDEEHDNSYNFTSQNAYYTLEVAKFRMEGTGKIVLGSATPKVSTYYKAESGEYGLFKLKNRAVKGALLPKVHIADMRSELIRGNTSIFSGILKEKLDETIKNKNQAILFLNRRGYSNFVSCRSCGEVIKCDNCDISMTYHKDMNILRCHYCGATKKMVTTCPNCGSSFIKRFGIGTQQVEAEVKKFYPDANVFRMDRDTMGRKDSYDKMYENMKSGNIDILIGTQMISKGFDFENVSLVGIIAADMSLYVSDYRANETTFQLITQVSGRAGRGSVSGSCVIQTYTPDSYSITHAARSDYEGFYKDELYLREKMEYPPFEELISVVFTSGTEKGLKEFAQDFLEVLTYKCQDLIKYSQVTTMPKIKNIYKVRFMLKVMPQRRNELLTTLEWVKENMKNNRIDVFIEF